LGKETVQIIHNPVTAMVVEPSQDMKMWFSETLSYTVLGHEHMGATNWNGRNSFFTPSTRKFPAGFVRLIQKRLERQGHRVIVKSKPAPEHLGPEMPKVDDYPADPRYGYQDDVASRLLNLKTMIAQISTGGGKSRCFKLCAERIGRPTLFVTTRKSLMYQMGEDFEKSLKRPVGYLGDGKWNPKPDGVNFAIVDSLIARIDAMDTKTEFQRLKNTMIDKREVKIVALLKKAGLTKDLSMFHTPPVELVKKHAAIRKGAIASMPIDDAKVLELAKVRSARHNLRRKELMEFLSSVEFVCLEEAHEVSSNSYYSVMAACKNAHYRLALTATPFMKDDEEANMRLMACTGPIGIKVTEKQLIDLGILAKPYFLFEKLGRVPMMFRSTDWQKAEKMGITDNDERNNKIVTHSINAKTYGLPVMCLVQKVKHGKVIEKLMHSKGLRVTFISGNSNQKARQDALNALGDGKIDVLIGSTILDVGVDVPSIGLVILAGGGKAEVALRQRIGRGLRAKKTGPNIAFVVDFADGGNKHLSKHSAARRAIIEDTPGFQENIVTSFDFESHGLKRLH